MASTESMPNIRNPAPHRGFNAKAREVLLDSEQMMNRHGLDRAGSDDEFRRKLNGIRLIRTDSEVANTSQKSTSTQNYFGQVKAKFDELDDLPKTRSPHKFISEIGKTKSASDLLKKKTVIHTFKQLNVLKMPSVESDIGGKDGVHAPMHSSSSSSIIDIAQTSERQLQYALK